MNIAVVTLSVLFFTSVMLSITMLLAWRECGRPRHARTWAIAFAVAAAQWLVNGLWLLLAPGSLIFAMLNTLLILMTCALSAAGCRQRAGFPDRTGLFVAGIAAVLVLVLVTTTLFPHFGLRVGIPNFFALLMFTIGGVAVIPRGRSPYPTEIALVVVFLLFALLELVIGSVAIGLGPHGQGPGLQLYRALIMIGLPSGYLAAGMAAVLLLVSDLAQQLRRLAASDPLTGILNRRGFEEAAARVLANARRHRQPLSLAIADLDYFKEVNDRFGHAVGDSALQRFTELIAVEIRRGDLFARLGGEEFALVLTATPAAAAVEVLDRLRARIATLTVEGPPGGAPPFTMTASFGVTEMRESDVALASLVDRADGALYRAKLEGRNRVVVSPSPLRAIPAIETAAR